MDVAMVYPRFDSLGGAERFGLEVMAEWSRKHNVTLYALSVNRRLLEEYNVEVDAVECKAKVPGWRSNTLALMAAVKSMTGMLGRHELYVLNTFPAHVIDRHPNVWYPQEPARMLYDLYPEILSRPMDAGRRMFMRAYFPLLRSLDRRFNRADMMLANSMYSAGYLGSVYGTKPRVVYCGARPVAGRKGGSDYALSVGRLTYEKRTGLAVQAAKEAQVRIKVVGTGPEEAALRRLGGADAEFLGSVGTDELERLYSNALCTVYAPLREPFGLVPLESMAAGTPVIGGRTGGYTEIVEDGVDGFLVEENPGSMAEKIRRLGDDKTLYALMSANARKKAGEHTWARTAESILKEAADGA